MRELFIALHQGLGDGILCNGLIREKAKEYDKVYIPCYEHNYPSISWMVSDNSKIIVEPIAHQDLMYALANSHEAAGHEVLKLGMYLGEPPLGPESFDQTFYRQAGVNFDKRWDAFTLPPHKDFTIYSEPYAVVCDAPDRGFTIDTSLVNPRLRLVRLWQSHTIFDFISLFMGATEIHAVDSAPIHLVESIPTTAKLFYHLYARNNGPYHQAKKRKQWKIVER